MNFEGTLAAQGKRAYHDFFRDGYSRVGEVTESDLFTKDVPPFFLVQEFRWISLTLANEYPALMPGMMSCLPTLVRFTEQNRQRAYLLHAFTSACVEELFAAELSPEVTAVTLSAFVHEDQSTTTRRVQKKTAEEVVEIVGGLEEVTTVVAHHYSEPFLDVIAFQNVLYFFDKLRRPTGTFIVAKK